MVQYSPLPPVSALPKDDWETIDTWAAQNFRGVLDEQDVLRNLASDPYFIMKYQKGTTGMRGRNSGTVGVSSTVAASVNHGLRGLPGGVLVTPNTSVGSFWVGVRTTVAFIINWQVSASVNYDWEAYL